MKIKTFIQTEEFSRNWDKLGLNDDDLRRLELEIMLNPSAGDVIPETGGLRKIRVPIRNRGRRSGARVCYVDFVLSEVIYLITVYSKNVKTNLSKKECQNIRKMIETLQFELNRERR